MFFLQNVWNLAQGPTSNLILTRPIFWLNSIILCNWAREKYLETIRDRIATARAATSGTRAAVPETALRVNRKRVVERLRCSLTSPLTSSVVRWQARVSRKQLRGHSETLMTLLTRCINICATHLLVKLRDTKCLGEGSRSHFHCIQIFRSRHLTFPWAAYWNW